MHNRCELPKDTGFRIVGDKPPVQSKLRPEHIKEIVTTIVNPLYQSIVLCMLGGALGINEVFYWSDNGWPSLREQLETQIDIIKIDLPGRKKSRNVKNDYSLIGGDALRALRGYIGNNLDREAIFINQYGDPLRRTGLNMWWRRKLTRLGYIKPIQNGSTGNRYSYGLHELRDNFRTLWARTSANSDIGEFIMGHTIDANGYNQIYRDVEFAKEQYKIALPRLNVVSGDLNLEQNQELKALRQRVKELESTKQELKSTKGEILMLQHQLNDILHYLGRSNIYTGNLEETPLPPWATKHEPKKEDS